MDLAAAPPADRIDAVTRRPPAPPRALHPGAWWLWALGLATAASRTTNPWLLLLVLAVAGHVVTARRSDAPWARSFVVFLKLGLIVIAIRVVAQTLFGTPAPGSVLVDLPEVGLPAWAAGVTLGGPITDTALAGALVDGLRLATMLACIGAANALANPKRLLATVPAALYEVGVAVVVALSFAPSMVASVQRIRAARRLRGRPDRGLRSIVTVAMPVLEDALERSLALAAAMDSRGYGRRATVPARTRRLTTTLTLLGLGGTLVGLYGLLDGTGPAALGLPTLLLGIVVAAASLRSAGAGVTRTRYRPDPWSGPEWLTTAAGVTAAAGTIVTSLTVPGVLDPAPWPLLAVPLPAAATVGILVALLPAWLTPPPLMMTAVRRQPRRRTDPAVQAPATSVSPSSEVAA
ncbi:MAG: energy-coupling factor transporter transmembrane protein EcfT [Nitriliruptor sp.]|nr:MAG: energy-coupling factor transporter transmembrane protein EcfT [Nitriliruptor sp.]